MSINVEIDELNEIINNLKYEINQIVDYTVVNVRVRQDNGTFTNQISFKVRDKIRPMYKSACSISNLKEILQQMKSNSNYFDLENLKHSLEFIKCIDFSNIQTEFESEDECIEETEKKCQEIRKKIGIAVVYFESIIRSRSVESAIINNKIYKLSNCGEKRFPVYSHVNDITSSRNYVLQIEAPTGSGKTRIVPFIIAGTAINEGLIRPFIIVTQPSQTIVFEKIRDFKTIAGNSVILAETPEDLRKLYRSKRFSKPVVGIVTPLEALKLMSELGDGDLFRRTRFILDEVHERPVHLDVLLARLGTKCSFPLNVVLMTATPDPSVLRPFPVERCGRITFKRGTVRKSLHRVNTFTIEVKGIDEIPEKTAEMVCRSLDTMKPGGFAPGHILVFLPNKRRIQELIRNIKEIKSEEYVIIDIPVIPHEEGEAFLGRVQKFMQKHPGKRFALPLAVAEYASQAQQEVALRPLPAEFDDVVKVIAATNIIESSVTIENLAYVVDSCLFDFREFNEQKGVTIVREMLIDETMRDQRRGRVGRVRDGAYVYICPPGRLPPHPPEICSTDLSESVLLLRRVGVCLEAIENMPNNPPEGSVARIVGKLKDYEALDVYGRITGFGERILQYGGFTPLLAAAISHVKDDDDDPMFEPLLVLMAQVMGDGRLVINPLSTALLESFCQESDIVTVADAVIPLFKVEDESLREECSRMGFNFDSFVRIRSIIEEILKRNTGGSDDMWDDFVTFASEANLLSIFDDIIAWINHLDNEWLAKKMCTIEGLSVVDGDVVMRFKNPILGTISVPHRPGCTVASSSGSIFLFNVYEDQAEGHMIGSVVHANNIEPSHLSVSTIIEESDFNPVFTAPLVEAMQGNSPFVKAFDDNGQISFVSTDVQGKEGANTGISFIGRVPNAKEKFEEAVNKIRRLMPFVGGSVTVFTKNPFSVVEIIFNGTTRYITNIYTMSDFQAFVYPINLRTLEYLLKPSSIQKLSKECPSMRISLVTDIFTEKFNNSRDFNRPIVASGQPHILTDNNRIVLISSEEIPSLEPRLLLRQTEDVSSFNPIFESANSIFREKVSFEQTEKIVAIVYKDHQIEEDMEIQYNKLFKNRKLCNNLPHSVGGDSFASFVAEHRYETYKYLFEEYQNKSYERNKRMEELQRKQNSLKELLNAKYAININDGEIPPEVNENRVVRIAKKYFNKEVANINTDEIKKEMKLTTNEMINIQEDIKIPEQNLKELEKVSEEIQKLTEVIPTQFELPDIRYGTLGNNVYFIPDKTNTEAKIRSQVRKIQGEAMFEVLPVVTARIAILDRRNILGIKSKIDQVVDKFGYTVIQVRITDNHFEVDLIGTQFLVPFAYELRNALQGNENRTMRFPPDVLTQRMLEIPAVRSEVEKWLWANGFNSIKIINGDVIGPADRVEEAMGLLRNPKTAMSLSWKPFPIPSGAALDTITISVKARNENMFSSWIVDRQKRALIAPVSNEKEVLEFLKEFPERKNDDQWGCLFMCDENDREISKNEFTLHEKDPKKTISKPICIDCVQMTMRNALEKFVIGDDNVGIDWNLLMANKEILGKIGLEMAKYDEETGEVWPKLPIAQYFYGCLQIPQLSGLVRAWVSAVAWQTLRTNSSLFTYCPNHPEILFERSKKGTLINCKVRGCKLSLCPKCNTWHDVNDLKSTCFDWEGKRCPKCGIPFMKDGGCNHISCTCGAHWCYACEPQAKEWYKTDDEVYRHLRAVHGGIGI